MRSSDPNFPPEIPPIPPARDDSRPVSDLHSQPEPPDPGSLIDDPTDDDESILPRPAASPALDPGAEAEDSAQTNHRAGGRDRPLGDNAEARSQGRSGSPEQKPAKPGARPTPEDWTDSDLRTTAPLSSRPRRPAQPPTPDRPVTSLRTTASRAMPPAEEVWTDTDIPYQPKQLGVVDQLLLLLADGFTQWKRFLRWGRSQLPPNLQRQLSDDLLTAIALGLLVLLLALWNPLGLGRSTRTAADHESLPRLTAQAPDAEDAMAIAEGQPATAAPALPSEEPRALDPTPEEGLIADIQTRVSAISRSYGAGLVQSVEVNLTGNTLGINLAEAWYGLLTAQQDEIAQDIYNQAQGLHFGTLQLRDPNGVVVARNPVVGTTMVVLHRQRSPEAI